MYPTVNVSEAFLDHFDEEIKTLPADNQIITLDNANSNKKTSIERLKSLLKNANLNIDLDYKTVVKYAKSIRSDCKNYKTYKDLFIHNAIKNQRLSATEKVRDYINNNEPYFTGLDGGEANEKTRKKGIIVLGNNCLESPFFLNHSFPVTETNAQLDEFNRCIHPCSSMVIIDKYLFSNDNGGKINNLITLLKKIISNELENPFELDIFIENPNNNNLLEQKYSLISNEFNNLSFHLYAPNKLIENDRYFITNYAVVTVGHPLDRPSNISSNFYLSHEDSINIKSGFKMWQNKLRFAHGILMNIPERIGTIKYAKKSDTLEHKIFRDI